MNVPEENSTPPPQQPFGNLLAALWMLGAVLSVVLFIGFVHSILPEIGRDLVSLGALSAIVFLALTAFLLQKHPGGSTLGHALGLRSAHPALWILAILIGISARGPAEGLRHWSAQLFDVSDQTEAALSEMTQIHSVSHAVFMMLVMALLVPLGEEVFFRGGVYCALRRSESSATNAAFVTSLGFALSHPQALVPISLVAGIFGLLRASSGSLFPSLVAHVAFNSVEVLEMSTSWVPKLDSSLILQLSAVLALLLLVFLFLVWNNPAAQKGRDLETGRVLSE